MPAFKTRALLSSASCGEAKCCQACHLYDSLGVFFFMQLEASIEHLSNISSMGEPGSLSQNMDVERAGAWFLEKVVKIRLRMKVLSGKLTPLCPPISAHHWVVASMANNRIAFLTSWGWMPRGEIRTRDTLGLFKERFFYINEF